MPRRKQTDAEREAAKQRRREYERDRKRRKHAENPEIGRAYQRAYRAKRRQDPAFVEQERQKRLIRLGRDPNERPSTRAKPRPKKPAGTVPHMTPTRKPAPKRAPADLRRAWRQAHENSVLKQKYPTVAKLDEAFRKGELNVPQG